MSTETKKVYNHYYKNVEHLTHIDVYRVLELFGVTNPCVQHAVKKLLVAGARGAKDVKKDLREAVVSINRAIEMSEENILQQTGEAPPVADRDAIAATLLHKVPCQTWRVNYGLQGEGPWIGHVDVPAFADTEALFIAKNQLETMFHLQTQHLRFDVKELRLAG